MTVLVRDIDRETTPHPGNPSTGLPKVLLVAGLVLGCMARPAPALDTLEDANQFEPVTAGLFVEDAGIWPVPNIPVCFEADFVGSPQFWDRPDIIKRAVVNSWEAETSLSFKWKTGTCVAGDPGIHIRMYLTPPAVGGCPSTARGCARQGRHRINGITNGMQIKIDSDFSAEEIGRIAIHEFGHALGFAHEHLRSDRPTGCQPDPDPLPANHRVGIYDELSIMAQGPNCGGSNSISASDIAGAQRYYGSTRQVSFAPNVTELHSWTVGVRGSAPDAEFLFKQDNGNGWYQANLDRYAGTALLLSWGVGRLDTFWRRAYMPDDAGPGSAASQDGDWVHAWSDNGSGGIEALPAVPGGMRGSPVGLALGVNELEVWGRTGPGRLGRLTWRSSTEWTFQEGSQVILGDPALAVIGDNVFVFARRNDNKLIWAAVNRHNPNWPIFLTEAGGQISSSPVAVPYTSGTGQQRVAVFASGPWPARHLHQWTCGNNCAGPFDHFGDLIGTPTVLMDSNNQNMEVFARGTDNQVYLMNCLGTDAEFRCNAWRAMISSFQAINGSPVAFRTATLKFLFARNDQGNLIFSFSPDTSRIWSGWNNMEGFYR